LLRGDTLNTNASWIAKKLSERGMDIYKILVIPDDVDEISSSIRESDEEIIIITGGLGPTPDDMTRKGVADAFGDVLVMREDLLDEMREVHEVTKDAEVMAQLPSKAVPLKNPVGSAPGFVIGDGNRMVFVLPGVPEEMKAMFDDVLRHLEKFGKKKHYVAYIKTAKPEASIASELNEFVRRFPSVKLGSYPKGEQVYIRLSSRDKSELERAVEWLKKQIE